ncbi:hypothetical protein [Azorhizobium doebereinerae]|nr:hypothetical protein [Azorhizobium doebereinerae]
MSATHGRSCWCFARLALTAFGLGIAIVYVFGGFDLNLIAMH